MIKTEWPPIFPMYQNFNYENLLPVLFSKAKNRNYQMIAITFKDCIKIIFSRKFEFIPKIIKVIKTKIRAIKIILIFINGLS